MNVYFLDADPKRCAEAHCDRHVIKQIIEAAQMLSTAHRVLDPHLEQKHNALGLYRIINKNHPWNVWTRSATGNYQWLYKLYAALCKEYVRRYNRAHKTFELDAGLRNPPVNIDDIAFINPPHHVPDEYKRDHVTASYRNYYVFEKAKIATWKAPAECPKWFVVPNSQ